MDTANTPDSWDQSEKSGTGDHGAVDDISNSFSGLNVQAAEFVPGLNIHAPAFVPSFGSDATGLCSYPV